jgi:hypothetical protein
MIARKKGQFLADGVKDLAKYGMRTTAIIGVSHGGGAGARAALTAFPDDPAQWEKEVAIEIKTERLAVGGKLQSWQKRTNDDDATFSRDFNPVEAVTDALRIQGRRLADLKEVDVEKLALDIEKGMWTTWMLEFAWTNEMLHGRMIGGQSLHNLSGRIEKRCEELGIDIGPLMAASLKERRAEYREWSKAHPDE